MKPSKYILIAEDKTLTCADPDAVHPSHMNSPLLIQKRRTDPSFVIRSCRFFEEGCSTFAFQSKYPGRCNTCALPYKRGELIFPAPETQNVYQHFPTCPEEVTGEFDGFPKPAQECSLCVFCKNLINVGELVCRVASGNRVRTFHPVCQSRRSNHPHKRARLTGEDDRDSDGTTTEGELSTSQHSS
jgi:hypothetical protein